MNGVQTRFKCKLDVKRCKRFVFPPSSLLPRSNALKTKAIRYFQTDRTLTRIVSPPLNVMVEKLVTKAELARRLQVKPQSVDYMLTRKSIDTDTLYNVSKALDYDFALLYSIDKEQMNYDRENEAYKLSTAKILIELELKPDEIIKLNLRKKISELLR